MHPRRIILILTAAVCSLGSAAHAAPLPGPAAAKIDSRLLAKTLAAPDEVVSAWVEFTDKGERGPDDLARRLADVERSLSPRDRARRIKAGVTPLVDVLDLPVSRDYLDRLTAKGLKPYAVSRWFNRAAVRVPAGDLPRIAELQCVRRLAKVERARVVVDPGANESVGWGAAEELSSRSEAPEQPTSVNYGVKLKELAQLNLPAVHDLGYIGQGVLICMLDNGFIRVDTHRAMVGIDNPPGYRRDFVDGDTELTDEGASFHGMRTLSCIGANLPGHLVGAAYGATFALARTENDTTETPVEMTNWVMGAEWADSLGADIISSSLGYFDFDPAGPGGPDYTYADMDGHTTVVTRGAEIAAAKGILVVNAAGNEGNQPWFYIIAPADADGDSVLAAGAVDSTGVIAAFSSRGPSSDGRIKPDLSTRGVRNWTPPGSPATDSTYSQVSGTSFACPLLAGTVACIMSGHPNWTPYTVIRALRETASRFTTPGNVYGYGIPDALAALNWSDPTVSAPPGPARAFGIWLAGPNPIRPGGSAAAVRFALGAEAATAAVRVLDVSGRAVRTLWSGSLARDQVMEARWDGSAGDGRRVGPGVYWIALQAGGRRASVRVASL